MNQTYYPWYIVGILIISAVLLFVFDARISASKNRGRERAIVRSFGWVHAVIAVAGLLALLMYILLQ
ncbi:CLC_0170 family protein [Paenibacillus lemnae]|uniref:Uncharacterized protein n=1 Tax=Paenibacillus lemnae TaxID=1330551 RepID=A0A848M5Q5_PAELE|nr:CLC_0170 family protein [Paenibacillus lemnae]NMO96287.1 hypothetical protein [Paenibacillus lemnae]